MENVEDDGFRGFNGKTWEESLTEVKDGPLKGWTHYDGFDPFETHVGQLVTKVRDASEDMSGKPVAGFVVEEKHVNGGGRVHGGMYMAFADFALFAIAGPLLDGPCVTLSVNCDFVAGAEIGDVVLARGEVVRNSRSICFIRGELYLEGKEGQDDRPLLTFNGIVKKIGQ